MLKDKTRVFVQDRLCFILAFMSISGIQGLPFEVTVVGCNNLEDKEWISKQDPYVCLEYGSSKFRTRTCTDGGKNPAFQEKFIFTLIEGLRELNVMVWNSNRLVADELIGSGRIQLHKVLSQGFEDCTWPIQSQTGRHAGEVRLIMHNPNAKQSQSQSQPQKVKTKGVSSVSEYAPSAPFVQVSPYGHPPPAPAPAPATYPTAMPYAVPPSSYNSYPPRAATSSPSRYAGYPPHVHHAAYPQQTYPPPPQSSHGTYHQQAYLPPPQASAYYPPAPSGIYPPPPY